MAVENLNHEELIKNGYTLITPELANTWLQKNKKNRKVREKFVSQLVDKIRNGEWQPDTLDHIGFFADGELANGQHRLMAIAKSGMSVYSKVEFNVPRSAAICIDSGKPRTPGDNIAVMTGKTFYTNIISSMMKISVFGKSLTHEDHLKLATRFEKEIMTIVDMFSGAPRPLKNSSLMAAIFLAMIHGEDVADLRNYVDVVFRGSIVDDRDSCPVLLKQRIFDEYYNKGGKLRHDYAYEIKRAQNNLYNFLKHKALTKLVVPEDFRYSKIFLNPDTGSIIILE